MIHTRNGIDTPRITAKTASKSDAPPPKAPGSAGSPSPAQAATIMTGPGRVAPKTSTTSANLGAAPPKPSKPKESASTPSSRASARREAHTGHATVAPRDERGSGGGKGGGFGSQRDGQHQDIHDWMPFSAQQSRIIRRTPPHHAPGLPKLAAHPFHPMGLKSVVLSMAGRFYTEVLPSIFRRTPQQVDQANRDIRKDALRKTEKHRTERNEARREEVRRRAYSEGNRVMAGDLTRAFAGV
jgi:hypothetical protein